MLRSLLNWQLLYSKQSSFFWNKTMDRSVGIRLQGGFYMPGKAETGEKTVRFASKKC